MSEVLLDVLVRSHQVLKNHPINQKRVFCNRKRSLALKTLDGVICHSIAEDCDVFHLSTYDFLFIFCLMAKGYGLI